MTIPPTGSVMPVATERREHQRAGQRGDHLPWQPDRSESASDGCAGYAERLDGVSARASPSADRTQVGGRVYAPTGRPAPIARLPGGRRGEAASDGGGGQTQRSSDPTVTQAGHLGQECCPDDLDHVEAAEQRGGWDQHVRRLARPAARARKRRRRRPSGQRSSCSLANPLGPSTPPAHDGHHRRPSRSRASTSSGWSPTASTLESSLPDSRPNPPRPALSAGRVNSCCGSSDTATRQRGQCPSRSPSSWWPRIASPSSFDAGC